MHVMITVPPPFPPFFFLFLSNKGKHGRLMSGTNMYGHSIMKNSHQDQISRINKTCGPGCTVLVQDGNLLPAVGYPGTEYETIKSRFISV